MKKVIVSVIAVVALLTSTHSTAFALCEKTPVVSQVGRTATIYGDLSNPDSYSNELQKLLLDPDIDGVYVLDPTLDSASDSSNLKGVNEVEPQGGPTYHTHRITNVRTGDDYVGTNKIATVSGVPGDTLQISISKSVSRTYSCNVSAVSAGTISTAVGYSVTDSASVSFGVNSPVPSTNAGRKVARMTVNAYPIYKTTNFTVQKRLHKNGLMYPWETCGSGYARNPYGAYYTRVYTYK